ncbi:pentapeptide repeat-containing protein [Streptomyces sp. NPDC059979]|uniref:pentapeptide repeat-containing protein n=1 Tax=unclassified Streptomyces TaxID=2593676 RepID=UPI00366A4ACF
MILVPETGPLAWVLIGVLLFLGALGGIGAVAAWKMAVREPESEPRIEVLAGIGGGLVTGIAIGISALFLEQSMGESQKYAAWRANVEIAQTIPGFTPRGRDMEGINFSGKGLPNADLHDAELGDLKFRETELRGADLSGAQLQRADLIGANLYEATLRGANLEGASLHSANLSHAVVNDDETSFDGAKVNAYTCWPNGVLPEKLAHVILEGYVDELTGEKLGPSEDMRDGLKGGEEAPDCTLWEGGEEVR